MGKSRLLLRILFVGIYSIFISCNKNNRFKSVKIGTQTWMDKNLAVEKYRNGDIIPQVQEPQKWEALKTGAWCYYENNSQNGQPYGKLYNWYAVVDSRGLAPTGWRIPDYNDWQILIDHLGGSNLAGGKLKSTALWQSPNKGATNESGFAALPAGKRFNGHFILLREHTTFWALALTSNSVDITETIHNPSLDYDKSGMGYDQITMFNEFNMGLGLGFSIRCIKE